MSTVGTGDKLGTGFVVRILTRRAWRVELVNNMINYLYINTSVNEIQPDLSVTLVL